MLGLAGKLTVWRSEDPPRLEMTSNKVSSSCCQQGLIKELTTFGGCTNVELRTGTEEAWLLLIRWPLVKEESMVFAIGDQSSPKRVASGEFSEVSRQHYSLMIHYHHYHHYYHYYSLLFTIIHYYSVLSKFGRSVPSSSSFLMTCLRLQQNNECDKLFSWPHWPWLADDRWEVRQKKVRMGRFIHRVKSPIGKVALRSVIKNFHSIYSVSKTPVQPSAWSLLWMRRLRWWDFLPIGGIEVSTAR